MGMNEVICPNPVTDETLAGYMDQLNKTVRIDKADRERTAQIIAEAKGARSMRQFADQLGINVSSLSRILSCKVDTVNKDLLGRIAAYAVSDSQATLTALIDAQGLASRKMVPDTIKKYVNSCRRILADELISRGYAVSYDDSFSSPRLNDTIFDFVFQTNALRVDGENPSIGKWLFDVKMLPDGNPAKYIVRTREAFSQYMAYYYCGGTAERITMIVNQDGIFNYIKREYQALQIPDEISVILISIETGSVLDEFIIPTKESVPKRLFGREAQSS